MFFCFLIKMMLCLEIQQMIKVKCWFIQITQKKTVMTECLMNERLFAYKNKLPPSVFCCLSGDGLRGQQSELRSPDFPHSHHLLQLVVEGGGRHTQRCSQATTSNLQPKILLHPKIVSVQRVQSEACGLFRFAEVLIWGKDWEESRDMA